MYYLSIKKLVTSPKLREFLLLDMKEHLGTIQRKTYTQTSVSSLNHRVQLRRNNMVACV